jgi:hypothetical protein
MYTPIYNGSLFDPAAAVLNVSLFGQYGLSDVTGDICPLGMLLLRFFGIARCSDWLIGYYCPTGLVAEYDLGFDPYPWLRGECPWAVSPSCTALIAFCQHPPFPVRMAPTLILLGYHNARSALPACNAISWWTMTLSLSTLLHELAKLASTVPTALA